MVMVTVPSLPSCQGVPGPCSDVLTLPESLVTTKYITYYILLLHASAWLYYILLLQRLETRPQNVVYTGNVT